MADKQVLVSVLCTAYNHEQYIRECIEGIVGQKTAFPFELVIHDDVSTDNTRSIIREYEEKYPHIIHPIYQTENQYSKGVDIFNEILVPRARGKYIAICEGDDCWISPEKLQKQVDFLQTHPECSACVSGAVMMDYSNGQKKSKAFPTETSRYIDVEEVIRAGASFPTASFVYRVDAIKEDIFRNIELDFGDLPLLLNLAVFGKVYAFHESFVLYRFATPGSWTSKNNQDTEGRVKNRNSQAKLFAALNAYTGDRYKEIADEVLLMYDFNILLEQGRVDELKQPPYDVLYRKRFGPVARVKAGLIKVFPFLIPMKQWMKTTIKKA